MTQFCPKCGQPIEENEKFCGACGALLEEETLKGPKNRKKWILRGGILLAAIVILAVVVSTVRSNTGYKGTLKKMAKAYEKNDVEAMIDITSSLETDIMGEEGLSDYWENLMEQKLDEYEDKVDEVKKIEIEVTDVKEISERKLEDAMEHVEDRYNVDTSDVKKAICVDLRLKIKGKKKKKMTDKMRDVYLLKENGGWKIYLSEDF